MIKLFFKNLISKASNGVPLAGSIATIITAIKEGKFDVRKSLWLLAEVAGILCVLWASLELAKHFNLTLDQILDAVQKIMKLGLGN